MTYRLIIGLVAWVSMTSMASADWNICNKTGYPVQVAIGYAKGKVWWSEGWWEIDPGGECLAVVSGDLANKYYYYYAAHLEVGGEWSGDYNFCVSDNAFTIKNRSSGDSLNCEGRSYDTEGFIEVDTKESRSWTTNLVD
ncbi:MAG: DUF1036 domain-containing protein [Alphaproteobacteria bacterium]|nr:DUF1036 domain-containing protein [Alphaproteobacteria bacterium]